MKIGAKYIIGENEHERIKGDEGAYRYIQKMLAERLTEKMLEEGIYEIRDVKYKEELMVFEERVVIDVPNCKCKECINYRKGYCTFNERNYPEDGFCSEGIGEIR